LNAEDALENVVVPRLLAAGADLNRVLSIRSVLKFDREGKPVDASFSLTEDIATLDRVLNDRSDVELIIIDPVSAYLGKVDSHNNSEVRAVLEPLARLAERHDVAVLCVSHLNKGSENTKALYRITGSLAFAAAARSVYAVGVHPDDYGLDAPRRVLTPVKSNLARPASTLAFEIKSKTVGEGLDIIPTSRVRWGDELDGVSAEDVLKAGTGKRKTKRQEAVEWLRDYLQDGEVHSDQVYKDGAQDGFSERTLRRAAEELGIARAKGDYQGTTMWRLPRTRPVL
jgi:putative DNA primase/helicase